MSVSVRNYEAIVIVHPDLNEEGVSKFQGQLGELMSRHGGRLVEAVSLGKRKLSFRVAKVSEGLYLKAQLQMPPSEVDDVEKAARLMEPIVRMMILKANRPTSRPRRLAQPNVEEESDGKLQ